MFDLDKLNFKVEKFPLAMVNWEGMPLREVVPEIISNKIGVGLRRTDTQEPIAIVSDTYEIVQFSDIAEQVGDAISQSGIDLTTMDTQTILSEDSTKLELIAKFPSHSKTIDDKGDEIVPSFTFRSSQDKSWANNGMMGFWRWSCYNTLVDGNKLAYVYGKHTKNFSIPSFASKIRGAAEYISNDGFKKMQNWYTHTISRDDAINLFSSTLAKRTDNVSRNNKPNKVMLSNLMKTFDEENRHLIGRGAYEKYSTRDEGSLWTAYQAATAWSTHTKNINVKPIREAKVIKMLKSPEWENLQYV